MVPEPEVESVGEDFTLILLVLPGLHFDDNTKVQYFTQQNYER